MVNSTAVVSALISEILCGRSPSDQLSEEVGEALADYEQIAQLEDEIGESEESDFFQIEEYVRMASILMFDECGVIKSTGV